MSKLLPSETIPGGRGRLWAAGLLLASVATPGSGLHAQEGPMPGERVVIVYEEPRHRLVVDGGAYKVLDIQIQPGDTTLWHTHDSPILYTFINLGRGSANGRVSSNTDYVNEPLTHEVTNSGNELFQIIAVASYLPARSNPDPPAPQGITADPQLVDPWFRSYRLELAPGQETPVHRHRNPAVVVQVTDGKAEVIREDGFGTRLHGQGKWAFQEPGATYRIRNAGTTPVAVVVNEPRESQ